MTDFVLGPYVGLNRGSVGTASHGRDKTGADRRRRVAKPARAPPLTLSLQCRIGRARSGEPASEHEARGGGRDPACDRGSEVGGGLSGVAAVHLEHDLNRERREGGEAAEKPDTESLAQVTGEPVLRGEQTEQERPDDVDADGRPDQRFGVERQPRKAVSG